MRKHANKKHDMIGDETSTSSESTPPPPSTSANYAEASPIIQLSNHGLVLCDEPAAPAEDNSQPFTPQEEKDLQRCEAVIKKNENAFVETCAAMFEISSKRLYRQEYKSFQEYCERKWGFSREYGHRLVKDHEIIKKVSTIVHTSGLITNGNQVAELSKVPEEDLAAVAQEAKNAAGKGKLTGRHIKEAAKRVREKREGKPATKSPKAEADTEATITLREEGSHDLCTLRDTVEYVRDLVNQGAKKEEILAELNQALETLNFFLLQTCPI